MCPVCIATAAWLAAGAGSSGGLGALVLLSKRASGAAGAATPGPARTQRRALNAHTLARERKASRCA